MSLGGEIGEAAMMSSNVASFVVGVMGIEPENSGSGMTSKLLQRTKLPGGCDCTDAELDLFVEVRSEQTSSDFVGKAEVRSEDSSSALWFEVRLEGKIAIYQVTKVPVCLPKLWLSQK